MDFTPIIIAAIAALGPTIAAIGAWHSSRKTRTDNREQHGGARTDLQRLTDEVALVTMAVGVLREDFTAVRTSVAELKGAVTAHIQDHRSHGGG